MLNHVGVPFGGGRQEDMIDFSRYQAIELCLICHVRQEGLFFNDHMRQS